MFVASECTSVPQRQNSFVKMVFLVLRLRHQGHKSAIDRATNSARFIFTQNETPPRGVLIALIDRYMLKRLCSLCSWFSPLTAPAVVTATVFHVAISAADHPKFCVRAHRCTYLYVVDRPDVFKAR